MSSPSKELAAVDLFCGSGAVTTGLKAGGFRVLSAVDLDPIACETYRLNHAEVSLLEKDIREISNREIRSMVPKGQQLDLLVVCAPCQPFSTQNRKQYAEDPRADLILESCKFISVLKPHIVFFENVPGIASKGPVEELQGRLETLGYFLSAVKKVDAANLGVPQRRTRGIMIAARNPDIVENFGKNIVPLSKVTVHDALGHLKPLVAGENDPRDPLHFARKHQAIALERLRHIPKDGGSRKALPKRLELKCHKDSDAFPDVYGRMKWNDVAPTLTTGCTDLTRGRYAHPRDDRAITLREAALLQTFPKNYRFHGNSGQIATQIGNAVPVKMIQVLSQHLREAISQSKVLYDKTVNV